MTTKTAKGLVRGRKASGSAPGADTLTIKMLANCSTANKSLALGKTYKAPSDIRVEDAETLIRIGRATRHA